MRTVEADPSVGTVAAQPAGPGALVASRRFARIFDVSVQPPAPVTDAGEEPFGVSVGAAHDGQRSCKGR
jgi:hypothetical protein